MIGTKLQFQTKKRPVVFGSIAHIGELGVLLRVASQFAQEHQEQDVVVITTDDGKKSVDAVISKHSNMSFRSFGPSSSISKELTRTLVELSNNGPSPFTLFDISITWGKTENYRSLFSNIASIIQDLQPSLCVIDFASFILVDAVVYSQVEFVLLFPTFVTITLTDEYFASALSYGFIFDGYSARNPTVTSILMSIWHRTMFIPLAIYKLIFAGFHAQRFATAKELKADFVVKKSINLARAAITACNWGIEYPMRFRPNIHLVGPIMPEHETIGSSPSAKDTELLKWMDSSARKVILVSLGSLTPMKPYETEEFIDQLHSAIKSCNARVIWKFHKSQIEFINGVLKKQKISTNDFKAVSWVDDLHGLLKHPKVAVNINHAGGNSFNEALYFGVPQLWIPLWIDCFDLAVRGDSAGIGINVLCKKNYKGVGPALEKLLTDEKYKLTAMLWSEKSKVDGGRKRSAQIVADVLQQVEIEERYGVDKRHMNSQVNKVINDPPFVNAILLGFRALVLLLVFGLGWWISFQTGSRKVI
ncbi:hypothetical protein HK098_007784 [Nowakowskiella sp. JEL0407]|nr:hypothetical protein HK098_007784 [Nowakowskiella sp. JEL0407]